MSAELKSAAGRTEHSARSHSAAEEPRNNQSEHATSEKSPTDVHAADDPVRTGVRWWRPFYRALQVVLAVGLGYGIATLRLADDTRIELPPAHARSERDAEAVTVTTASVERRHIERAIDAVGTLHGYDELTLKTKISGRVSKLYYDFADRVAPGTLLLEIDPTDSQLAVEQAKRSLDAELAKWGFQDVPGPNADLTQLPTVIAAKVRLDLAKSQLSRLNMLQNRGSVTADELEQARSNAMVAESDYANQLLLARAGAANAQSKKSDLAIAEQQLLETKIYVPMRERVGGHETPPYTITDRYVTEGVWLAAGTDLYRLVIDDTLKLRLSVPEKHASSVKVGQRVEVLTLTAGEPVLGQVTRIGPSVDPQTRTFQIEAEIPNKAATLKTGSFAKARVVINEEASAHTVPTAALVTFAGVHKVFVLRGDRVAEHQVQLGEQTAQWVELIDSGLPEDAQVIVSGQSQLADGSLVRLREQGVSSTSLKANPNVPMTRSVNSTRATMNSAGGGAN